MSGTYIIGVPGVCHVTGPDGTVTLAPGVPITALAVPEAAVLPAFLTDTDTIYATVIALSSPNQTLQVDDPVRDTDAFYAPSIVAEIPGHGTQHVRPGRVIDAEVIYAAAVGRFLKPSLVTDDDTVYAASAVLVLRPALLPSDDAVYAFTTTRFVQSSFVSDSDVVPAADVGWHLFVDAPVADVDQVFAVDAYAYNELMPDVWEDEEHLEGYPFRVQSVTGGIPAPPRLGLTGSLRPPHRVLTGSVKQPIRLTGSLSNKTRRVLTGSLRGVRYGTGRKR